MGKKSRKAGLQTDDRYVWKLKVIGDCNEVLEEIKKNLGHYGQRYFEDRLIFEDSDENETYLDGADARES